MKSTCLALIIFRPSNSILTDIKCSKNLPHNRLTGTLNKTGGTLPESDRIPDVIFLHTVHISGYPLSLHYPTCVLMTGDQAKYINLHDTVIYAYVISKLYHLFIYFKLEHI